MLVGIDHVVILVADLVAAIKNYEEQGFTVESGGWHPRGTHNALIGLADGSYLELLAFREERSSSKWWPKLALGGGLIAACMRTDDLGADIAAFRAAGIEMSEPRPLSRRRPDGYHLEWVLSTPDGEHADVLPFLIQDITPRSERVPKEHKHSNAVTAIGTVAFAVHDPEEVRRVYTSILGRKGEEVRHKELKGLGTRFAVGPHWIEVLGPTSPGGPVGRWLQTRGPSPIALILNTASGKSLEALTTADWLNWRRAHRSEKS